MLEKPDLADAVIVRELESHYAISVRGLEFLPVGNDQRAWAFRVEAADGAYFLKLRKGGTKPASLIAPALSEDPGH